MKNYISIIIPVYNEAGNIRDLIERINNTLVKADIGYEIIIIDDHSDDDTKSIVETLRGKYRIGYYIKKGRQGKAQSIIEGFSYINSTNLPDSVSQTANNESFQSQYIVIIDGDLQYPPETIPDMVQALNSGLDIVIARRKYIEAGKLRHLSGSIFSFIFGRILHGFPYDVQSGLKAFRMAIADQVSIKPRSGWMFDLEFLLQARNAGAKIGEIIMPFYNRSQGVSKVHIFSTSIEMAIDAVRLKFRNPAYMPFTQNTKHHKGNGFYYRGREYINYSDLQLKSSAFRRFIPSQIFILLLILVLFTVFVYLNHHLAVVSVVSTITVLYFLDLLFLFYLVVAALTYDPSLKISDEQIYGVRNSDLPIYTILCPLYKEAKVLRQFTSSIAALDYPKNKLQVLLLLEEDDAESKSEIENLTLPSYFEVHIIPDSRPKTKPKALNYGLQYAKGEYLVIYDAEDIPESDQIRKVSAAFEVSSPKVACIQAKLHYYNTEQNILTRLFSIEYLLMFDLILPGLQAIRAPIPLGGTSNHFRTMTLKGLNGWDAFNVTEDADLGIRLYKEGYQTEVIDSVTYEEANSRLLSWIKQRTRWIKGYIQTYFVHLRSRKMAFNISNPHLYTFHLIMGWKSLFLLVNPYLWVVTICYYIFRPVLGRTIESFFPPSIFYLGTIVLITGNFLYSYMYLIALGKRSQWNLAIYVFLVPFYWLMMSYAAISAIIEFIVKPHHWNKTVHGLYNGRIITNSKPDYIENRHFLSTENRGIL
jgi:cellulose synthase/poly-beta-1,6-N-acetylglucosamine synthase-like glycosyltransferase